MFEDWLEDVLLTEEEDVVLELVLEGTEELVVLEEVELLIEEGALELVVEEEVLELTEEALDVPQSPFQTF